MAEMVSQFVVSQTEESGCRDDTAAKDEEVSKSCVGTNESRGGSCDQNSVSCCSKKL